MFAVRGSRPLLCTGNGFGRSTTFGVRGASPLRFDKIDFRMILLCEFAGVAVRFSNDDFWNNVFGVAGVSNRRRARTFRYGGDSKCIFDLINVVCRNGRTIGFPTEKIIAKSPNVWL